MVPCVPSKALISLSCEEFQNRFVIFNSQNFLKFQVVSGVDYLCPFFLEENHARTAENGFKVVLVTCFFESTTALTWKYMVSCVPSKALISLSCEEFQSFFVIFNSQNFLKFQVVSGVDYLCPFFLEENHARTAEDGLKVVLVTCFLSRLLH